jgi:hypothetical protein
MSTSIPGFPASVASVMHRLAEINYRSCVTVLNMLNRAVMRDGIVDFVVGGITYPILLRTIEKHPDSFLCTAVKKEWHARGKPITVHRDGELFYHIYGYIVSGSLPKDVKCSSNVALLDLIRTEAEFFGLHELVDECLSAAGITPICTYKVVRSFIDELTANAHNYEIPVDYPAETTTPFLKALGTLSAPFFVKGQLLGHDDCNDTIFQSSTVSKLNVPEMTTAAAPSFLDNQALELLADKLHPSGLRYIKHAVLRHVRRLCPNSPIWLTPRKLVIHQKGAHFNRKRDTVRGDGHIGTVVVILNSKYTGGELRITHNGATEMVTECGNWVATFGDCRQKLSRVTSGARVSLVYDIHTTGPEGDERVIEPAAKRARTDRNVGEESSDTEEGTEGSCTPETTESEEVEEYEGYSGDHGFWDTDNYESDSVLERPNLRGVDTAAIHCAVRRELHRYEKIVICLQNLLPVGKPLSGADELLSEILRDRYDVQGVYCAVRRSANHDGPDCNDVTEEEVHAAILTSFEAPPDFGDRSTKVVVHAQLNPHTILRHTNAQYDDDEVSQWEETVYVVSALQVCRREKVDHR